MRKLNNFYGLIDTLCGACFIFGDNDIHNHGSIKECIELSTEKLDFIGTLEPILLNIVPFQPYTALKPVVAYAYQCEFSDDPRLNINMIFWDEEKRHYFFHVLIYIPETKKTFGHSMGPYPSTDEEMLEALAFRMKAHKKSNRPALINIMDCIRKPSLSSRLKFYLAKWMVQFHNRQKADEQPN